MQKNRFLLIAFVLVVIMAIMMMLTSVAIATGDTTKPVVTNVIPADGSTMYRNSAGTIYYQSGNATPLVISADYSDEAGDSGIDPTSVMVHLDIGNMLSTCAATASHVDCTATAADLFPGTHPIDVYVSDVDGNEKINRTYVTVAVDSAVPTYSGLAPANGSTIYTSQLNSTGINDMSALRFDYDLTDPAPSSGYSPMSHVNDSVPPGVAGAMISNSSCVKTPATNPTHYSCQVNRASLLHLGTNSFSILIKDKVGNTSSNYSDPASVSHYTVVDDVAPAVSSVAANSSTISATYTDPLPTGALSAANLASGINSATAMVHVDGDMIMVGCNATSTGISCATPAGLSDGVHSVEIFVTDIAGNPGSGSFSVTLPPTTLNYHWTWYDNVSMRNWMLMANPAGSGKTLDFDLSVEGAAQNLAPFALSGQPAGQVPQGMALTPIIDNLIGGPVKVTSLTGDKAIVSQRSLLGNSLEEVLGTDENKLSDHFWWTWYDQASPGMTNWVLVANPSDSETVHVVLSFTNQADGTLVTSENDIAHGKSWAPTFPGKMGGPVEVKAYKSGGSWDTEADRRNVIASQRVLSGYGTAFNEVPGIPDSELTNDYLWTWYDQVSAGATNWVLVANPSDTPVTYQIKIAGTAMPTTPDNPGTIPAHGKVTPTFPGTMDGPVEVTASANVIASQRVIFGPSFEEVPGYPQSALTSDYHWTWYDQVSAGSTNWVLVSNPSDTPVAYEIKIAGTVMPTSADNPGTIPAHGKVTPTFPGTMDGPMKVEATPGGNVMVSQRVLWNGYFNEVLGTVLE